jgi:hypothetical protein
MSKNEKIESTKQDKLYLYHENMADDKLNGVAK